MSSSAESSPAKPIRQEDLPFDFSQRSPVRRTGEQRRGKRSRTAALLGLTRNKFYRLLKMHGLEGESSDNERGESDWIQ